MELLILIWRETIRAIMTWFNEHNFVLNRVTVKVIRHEVLPYPAKPASVVSEMIFSIHIMVQYEQMESFENVTKPFKNMSFFK